MFLNDSSRKFQIFADSTLKDFRQYVVDLAVGKTAVFVYLRIWHCFNLDKILQKRRTLFTYNL